MRKVIIVSDYFSDEVQGGAELSLEALYEKLSNYNIEYELINALEVDSDYVVDNREALWIIGNFSRLKYTLFPIFKEQVDYIVIEFDYKYCMNRLPQLCEFKEQRPCDCHEYFGKEIADFYLHAKERIFMSHAQKRVYSSLFPALAGVNNLVYGSFFSDETIELIMSHKKMPEERKHKDTYAIINAKTWVKGYEQTIQFCESNNMNYTRLQKMEHEDLLKELSEYKGIVYMPRGYDTCPRMVTEAQLLGLDVITNDFVQSKDELELTYEEVLNKYKNSKLWACEVIRDYVNAKERLSV